MTMPLNISNSARGYKDIEREFSLQNNILTVTKVEGFYIIRNGLAKPFVTENLSAINLHHKLMMAIHEEKTPLLWIYSGDANYQKFAFGYDRFYDTGKIGHAALMENAIIAGELHLLEPMLWSISNESGAWGAMAKQPHKTKTLIEVANILKKEFSLNVMPEKAFSKNAIKRDLQTKLRAGQRKVIF